VMARANILANAENVLAPVLLLFQKRFVRHVKALANLVLKFVVVAMGLANLEPLLTCPVVSVKEKVYLPRNVIDVTVVDTSMLSAGNVTVLVGTNSLHSFVARVPGTLG